MLVGQCMMMMMRVLRASTEASFGGASSSGTKNAKEAKKTDKKSEVAPLGACERQLLNPVARARADGTGCALMDADADGVCACVLSTAGAVARVDLLDLPVHQYRPMETREGAYEDTTKSTDMGALLKETLPQSADIRKDNR